MLPGFAFLFGLGSLFVASCTPKPLLPRYDSEAQRLENYLRDCDRDGFDGGWSLISCAPPEYVEAIKEEYKLYEKIRRTPYYWAELACARGTSVAQERCRYFQWRCKKDNIPFDYAIVIKYCNSFGPLCRKKR